MTAWILLLPLAFAETPPPEPEAPTAPEPVAPLDDPSDPSDPSDPLYQEPTDSGEAAPAPSTEPASPPEPVQRPVPAPVAPDLDELGPVLDHPEPEPQGAEPSNPVPMGPAPRIPAPASASPSRTPPEPAPRVTEDLFVHLLPSLPERTVGGALAFGLLAGLLALVARSLASLKQRLLPAGLLPGALATLKALARFGAVVCLLVAASALLPASLRPALPFVVVGAAVAVGWSLRELLPDVIAGLAITLERPIRPGSWIAGDGFAGTVQQTGTRALWLVDREGRRVAVPWRRLLGSAVFDEPGRFPAITVTVPLSPSLDPRAARRLLREVAMASPWVAPGEAPEVLADLQQPGTWVVRARLLEGRHAPRFEASLVERARLAAPSLPLEPRSDG